MKIGYVLIVTYCQAVQFGPALNGDGCFSMPVEHFSGFEVCIPERERFRAMIGIDTADCRPKGVNLTSRRANRLAQSKMEIVR